MERKKLIECIDNGVIVKYKGIEYLPTAYTLRKNDGKWWHQAELQDVVSGRSVVIVSLGSVE